MNVDLEQAAEDYKNQVGDVPSTELEQEISKLGFIDGAEWQAERMYSEDEARGLVINAIERISIYAGVKKVYGDSIVNFANEWFNLNKK